MIEKVTFSQTGTTDLRMVNCGIEDCSPSFQWGPGIRDRYIIHLVISGKGIFKTKNQEFTVSKGEGFLITPGEVIEYRADPLFPWTYAWVGFDGIAVNKILADANCHSNYPVFPIENIGIFLSLVQKMLHCTTMKRGRDEMLLGLLYEFLSNLIQTNGSDDIKTKETLQETYLHNCLDFIANNFSTSITVSGLSKYIGLDRSYLYSLFMRYLHQSPKDYITLFRMKKAIEFLQTSLTINEVARSVGYEDALLFSKIFKRYTGVSPRNYRTTNFQSKKMV